MPIKDESDTMTADCIKTSVLSLISASMTYTVARHAPPQKCYYIAATTVIGAIGSIFSLFYIAVFLVKVTNCLSTFQHLNCCSNSSMICSLLVAIVCSIPKLLNTVPKKFYHQLALWQCNCSVMHTHQCTIIRFLYLKFCLHSFTC